MIGQRCTGAGRGPEVTADAATSKIGAPALPAWVISRPRLLARIGKGVRGPLTVVTGAPGAGKTVAVASWVAAQPASDPIAWLTVDEGDGNPDIFCRYLLEALRCSGVDLPPASRNPFRLDGIDHVGIAALATVLTRRERPMVLVLDDFRPAAGSALVNGMAYLLKLARPWLRLVVISRRDLPLPLHRYRLTGDVIEIRAEDLAFSEHETDQLMAQHGVVLRRESVRALQNRTEGWAAGLRLAAMSLDGHPEPDRLVAQIAGGDHAIAGYLVEEVLDAAQPAVRRLLLTTSILDRVNAEIAAELTAGTDGTSPGGAPYGTQFAEVVRQNAFIRPLGNGWYRYHQMFRDVLRLRLRHENPGQTDVLHRRAASWFSARGLLTEAVQHAAAAQDWQLACAMVVDRLAVGDLLGLRPAGLLGAVLRPLPEQVARAELEPALVSAALALGRGDEYGCQAALRRSAQLLAGRPDNEATTARLTAAVLHLVCARLYHETGVRQASAEVERLLDRLPLELIRTRPEVRALALAGRAGVELWAGQWAQAAERLAAAQSAAADTDSSYLRLDCLAQDALVEVLRGRWNRATELTTQATQLVPAQCMPAGWQVTALPVARAWIALQRCQLAEARQQLDQTDPALLACRHPLLASLRGLVSAQLDSAEGHDARALETLRQVSTASSLPPWLLRRLTLAEAEVHTASGAPGAAQQAALRAGGGQDADGAVVLARVQLYVGQPTDALGTLHPALTEMLSVRSEVRVQAWLLAAQACYASEDPARGRRSLDRALRLGEREQLRLPFAAVLPWLRVVLRSDQDLARNYPRLLEPLRIGLGQCGEPAAQPAPVLLLAKQLSDRELQVLAHLAQMRTSEEIAVEMYVSINTVKTHLKSIYRKLAVTRRGDAVRRAHQLNLLTPTEVPRQLQSQQT